MVVCSIAKILDHIQLHGTCTQYTHLSEHREPKLMRWWIFSDTQLDSKETTNNLADISTCPPPQGKRSIQSKLQQDKFLCY